MLLLAVDSSGRQGSLALARVGEGATELLDEITLAGGAFSAQLVPQIAGLLEKHSYSKNDLGGLAVVSGPGSFTGLRVGLAAIKALAEILEKPVASISLLEAVARNAKMQGRVFSLLDAGRSDFYVGDYDIGPPVRMHSERLLSREEFSAADKSQPVVTTDANIADFVRSSSFPVELVGYPRGAEIASLGWERIQRGETVLPENIEANYIRRTDAEIFSKPKPWLPMSLTIRPAIADDLPAILTVERSAASAAHWTREQYEQRLENGSILVAESIVDGEPCVTGFLCARFVADEWEIENVVVGEAKRGQGIADRLLKELMLRARNRGAVAVWLEVRDSNQAARRLYEKNGFQLTGRRREYYRNPTEDAVLYGRAADAPLSCN